MVTKRLQSRAHCATLVFEVPAKNRIHVILYVGDSTVCGDDIIDTLDAEFNDMTLTR